MSVPDDAELAAHWDAVAEEWADHPRSHNPKRYIAGPLFRRLWGDIRGQRVLDAGCGGGWLTRLAAADGARVVAVDFSTALIGHARALDGGTGATYLVGNLCDLSAFAAGAFDLVVSHCCLQDVRDYRGALRELGRVLRPGSRLILSVVHPWTWQDGAHWRPERRGEPFRGWVEDPRYLGERFMGPTMFHRPMAAYAQALTDAGLRLLGLHEPGPAEGTESVLGADPRWERWQRVPDFLFFHAER